MYPKYFAIKLWLYLTSLAYVNNETKHVHHTRKLNTLVLLLDFEVPVLSNILFRSYSLKTNTCSKPHIRHHNQIKSKKTMYIQLKTTCKLR
ncbi:hypothetical protein ACB098_12G008700 [Castanea mollissima]